MSDEIRRILIRDYGLTEKDIEDYLTDPDEALPRIQKRAHEGK